MLWRATLVLLAAAAALLPLPTSIVERAYSTSLYPRLQSLLTPVSNHVPFALFDALVAIVAGGWLFAVALDIGRYRRQWARLGGRLVLRTAVWTAALYLLFLLTWGLNYRRERLSDKLQFDSTAISADAARSVAVTSVNALNALHGRAHSVGWVPFGSIEPSLAKAFDKVQEDLGASSRFAVSRPKATLLDFYFRRAGVAGMTNPYFLETLVERNLLPFERPFVVAHEWSHLAGFADESEANFVGWLTCLRGSIPDQVQRLAVPLRRACRCGRSRRSFSSCGTTRTRPARRPAGRCSTTAAAGQSGGLGRRLACVRSISQSQSRRSRSAQLCRGCPPRARCEVRPGLDAAAAGEELDSLTRSSSRWHGTM